MKITNKDNADIERILTTLEKYIARENIKQLDVRNATYNNERIIEVAITTKEGFGYTDFFSMNYDHMD